MALRGEEEVIEKESREVAWSRTTAKLEGLAVCWAMLVTSSTGRGPLCVHYSSTEPVPAEPTMYRGCDTDSRLAEVEKIV